MIKVEEKPNTIKIFTKSGSKIIPKRIGMKKLFQILDRMKTKIKIKSENNVLLIRV